jgi:DNA-binding GntR family transcriptional regulator
MRGEGRKLKRVSPGRAAAKAPSPSADRSALPNEVCERLRRSIISGSLLPGDRIVEARLARQLGISRAPIREAARLLEREGLIVSRPGRGFIVRQITIQELQEIYDVRACIECFAVRRAVEGRDERLVDELGKIAERLMRANRAGAFSQQVAEDYNFHRAIVAAARNNRLLRSYDEIAGEMRMTLSLIGMAANTADRRMIAESHDKLLRVIGNGTPDEAEHELRAHIAMAWAETLARLMGSLQIGAALAPTVRKRRAAG